MELQTIEYEELEGNLTNSWTMEKIVKKNDCKHQVFISFFPYALCKKQGYIPVWCPPSNCPVEHAIDTNKEKKKEIK